MNTSSLVAGSVLFGGLLLAGGALALYKSNELSGASAEQASYEPTEAVDIVKVEPFEWQPMYQLVGTVVAIRSITLSNEIAGVVDAIEFESGQRVEAGDPLVHLDDETDRAALETRQAEARLATQQFQRFSDLIGQDAVSRAQFDEAQANREAAEARVHEQEAIVAKKTAPSKSHCLHSRSSTC